MRARFINEIKKGGSGIKALNIGYNLWKFDWNYVKKTWPKVLRKWCVSFNKEDRDGWKYIEDLKNLILEKMDEPAENLRCLQFGDFKLTDEQSDCELYMRSRIENAKKYLDSSDIIEVNINETNPNDEFTYTSINLNGIKSMKYCHIKVHIQKKINGYGSQNEYYQKHIGNMYIFKVK